MLFKATTRWHVLVGLLKCQTHLDIQDMKGTLTFLPLERFRHEAISVITRLRQLCVETEFQVVE